MESLLVLAVIVVLFLPIVAILIATSIQREMRRRMEQLEAESRDLRVMLEELRHRLAEQEGPLPATAERSGHHADAAEEAPAPGMPHEPIAAEPAGEPEHPEIEEEPVVSQTEQETPPRPTSPSRPAARPVTRPSRPPRPPKPARTREEWEDLVGGRLLNRIGALALIIGVGFFLKYAFDREWITETMRAILGGVLGLGLLLIGYRSFRKGFQVFSQGLIGAGIAVLYLSVYAAFNFYHLGLSQTTAFLMMTAVTVIAFQQAFQYNSVAVSLLGLIGGFLTPLLLSTGQANQVGLFTYIALLDAGILAIVAVRRSWGVLEPLALAGTWLIYAGWFVEYYAPEHRGVTVAFTTILWALFFGLDTYRAFSGREPIPDISHVVAIVNAAVYSLALYVILDDRDGWVLTTVTVALGMAYFLPTLLTRGRRTSPFYAERSGVIGMVLFAVAVAVAPIGSTNDHLRVLLWGAESLGFLWLGARWKFPPVWGTALLLFMIDLIAMAVVSAIWSGTTLPSFPLTRGELMQGALALTAALATIPARELEGKVVPKGIPDAYRYVCAILVLVMITSLTDRATAALMPAGSATVPGLTPESITVMRLDFVGTLARAVVWLGYALLLLRLWTRNAMLPFLHTGLVALLLAIVTGCVGSLAYRPIQSFTPIANVRVLALLLLVGGTIVAARSLARRAKGNALAGRAADLLRIGAVLLIFELLTAETYDYFNAAMQTIVDAHRVPGPLDTARMEYLGNMRQLAISGIWLLYSAVLMVIGFMRRTRSLRIISFALFGLSILKIFVYDLSFLDTLYRIFSFIGLGVMLLSISYLYTRYKDQIFGASELPPDDGSEGRPDEAPGEIPDGAHPPAPAPPDAG